ncbi:hypothetical protein CBS101457_005163 [Exobasidium rhododendri]|nr:hypothetical protein CBS101457_005163 [Exobasidium rhododendri]
MAYVSLCKALYDYAATAEDELSFNEDALLYVVEADDPEWWKAKLKKSRAEGTDEEADDDDDDDAPIGLIPANYVEEAEPIRASRALYDYGKQNDDELELAEDEMVSVYETKGDWLLVKKQVDGIPTGYLGLVPANYVDEIAAVDGVTSAPLGAGADQSYDHDTAIPAAPATPTTQRAAKNDEIKMWAVSELDAKKKKKKGTLGIGNSSLFFASESDKAPVQKINVLSILAHTIEGKGKQLNLTLDEDGASKAKVDDDQSIKFVTSNKGEVEEIWNKIQYSQQKAREANEEAGAGVSATPAAVHNPPPRADNQRSSVPAPAANLPPPARTVSAAPRTAYTPPVASTPPPAASATAATKPARTGYVACIALYDFEAQGDDELSVAENEKLELVEKENEDWWKVQNTSGQQGVVPASYVETSKGEARGVAVAGAVNEEDEMEEDDGGAATAAAEEEERLRLEEEEEEAAEQNRVQAERRAKADAQRRAREAEERRREAIKSQPAPAPPKAPATTAITPSTSTRDVSIPNGRSAPARPKEATSKSKPSPARTRIWHDRSSQFKVEAEFLGFNQGKIRLHKLNGVVIEVAVEKMSNADIQYLEDVTGRKLNPQNRSKQGEGRSGGSSEDPRRVEREKERRREQEREQKRRQEAARGPKRNVDWFEFFLAAQVDVDDCTRYAAAFERDKIDEGVLPDMEPGILRSIGLREGDILRVMKFITKKYKSNGGAASGGRAGGSRPLSPSSQMKSDEALARKLQEQEQSARKNGVTPPPNLFSGPDGSLKNNTRRGRPAPSASRSMSSGVDAASLAAASESLARKSSPITRSSAASPEFTKASTPSIAVTANGFDDDAWTPRPSSTKPSTPAPPSASIPAPTPPPPPPVAQQQQQQQPAVAASPAPSTSAVVEAARPAPDPNSALFDKLAAMRPPSGGSMQRPGASPINNNMFQGPRGPYAPVAHNQNLLQPLISTQGTGQFLPTSLGHQATGVGLQAQQTGYMGPQQTGYMASQQTGFVGPQQTGYNGQSPFGMQSMIPQQTGFGGMQSPQYTGYQQSMPPIQPQMTNVSGFAQPQAPQYTQQQYQTQQQQRVNAEANSESNPDRFSAANVFGQMKQGNLHQDQDKNPQAPQKYDALRSQPTGFQPGGYLNPQFTGYTYQQY